MKIKVITYIFYFIYFIFSPLFYYYSKAEINLNSINETKTIINNKNSKNCKVGTCNIYGGVKSGKNLFHKFNSFDTRGSINEVKFFNGKQSNIIVGVSSKKGTFINKPIKLEREANLFWVSPSGIKIDNGGEFINTKNISFTTAESLNFSKNIFSVFNNNKYHLKDYSSEPTLNLNPINQSENLNSVKIKISDANIFIDEKLYLDSPNGMIDIKDTKIKTTSKNNGSITITGNSVLLRGDTLLLSNGEKYGGLIQIGGSWQNSNKKIRQSNRTVVEEKVLVDTSSNSGDGGIIVIWSDLKNKKSLTKVKGTLIVMGKKRVR